MPDSSSEVAILIKAQNQTAAAFTAARGELQKLGQTGQQTNQLLGALKSGLSSLGIAFGAQQVIKWGAQIVENAGHIQDLSDSIGISTTAVQRFSNAAEMGGGSIDDVGKAIMKMNVNLAGGSNSTKEALAAAGLGFEDIRNLSPEDAFQEIADAVSNIQDPMKKAEVATVLFGKGAEALLPTLASIKHASDEGLISPENIKALDDLGDAFTGALQKGKAFGAWLIGGFVRDLEAQQRGVEQLYLKLTLGAKGAEEALRQQRQMSEATAKQQEETSKITARALAYDAAQQEEWNAAVKTAQEENKKAAAAAEEHRKAIVKLAETYRGQDAITAANDALAALAVNLKKGHDISEMTEEQQTALNKTMGAAIDVYAAWGKTAKKAIQDVFDKTEALANLQTDAKIALDDWNAEVKRHLEEQRDAEEQTLAALKDFEDQRVDAAKAAMDDWNEIVKHHQDEQRQGEEETLAALKKRSDESKRALADLAQAFSVLAQISGGAFSDVVSGLGQIVGAANLAKKSIDNIQEAGKATNKLDGILQMTSGIMGIVSAALQAGKAIAALFDRNKGRDLVVDFADTFGGFDLLHQQLLALGDAGEQLWIKLTQGVGRNNPQQAQQVIDEVTKALEDQKKKQDDVTDVTEEAAAATIETATQASEALKTVGDQLETNKGQWSDWSSSVMGDIARVASSLGAVIVPSPSGSTPQGSFAGGTHGAYLDFGAGTSVMLHGRERVVTEQEGRSGGASIVFNLPPGMNPEAFREAGTAIVAAVSDVVRRGGTPRRQLQQALGM